MLHDWQPVQTQGTDRLLCKAEGRYLEVGDEVLKVMQLQQVVLALSQHSKRRPHEDVGAVLCQHDVNHPARKGGGERAAVDGQEPLRCI